MLKVNLSLVSSWVYSLILETSITKVYRMDYARAASVLNSLSREVQKIV